MPTLLDATVMTALVGRVPISGEVRDPMPFKVITGADNLAANGLRVPGVRGMVWSGTAIGDWTLGCVSGRLDSVTFVFDDGTIRTLSSDDQSLQGDGRSAEALGWISDQRGVPCVSGARKTNAGSYLAQRIATQAVSAAGDAAAAAETTSVISDGGAIQDRVTGDLERFIYGRTLSGSADELSDWLAERQSQSFDAVFVPAGVAVAIHVDRALAIDYNPQGRNLFMQITKPFHPQHFVFALLMSTSLIGCTTKRHVLPEDGPTIREIYDQHLGASEQTTTTAPAKKSSRPVAPLPERHETGSDVARQFPRLYNPTLRLYVYPHLDG